MLAHSLAGARAHARAHAGARREAVPRAAVRISFSLLRLSLAPLLCVARDPAIRWARSLTHLPLITLALA